MNEVKQDELESIQIKNAFNQTCFVKYKIRSDDEIIEVMSVALNVNCSWQTNFRGILNVVLQEDDWDKMAG